MSNTQEEYINSLKQIKEAEEKTNSEIENYRNTVEQEIKILEDELKEAITTSKSEGKKLVEKKIDEAKTNASTEADKIINDAEIKSKSLSIDSERQIIPEIIEMLLRM